MPTLFYGAILVMVAASFQILMSWRRKQISVRRSLLYFGIAALGAFGLVHGGVAYFTWMYTDAVKPQTLTALVAAPESQAYFKAETDISSLKVIDYRPDHCEVLVRDNAGHAFSVRLKSSSENKLDLAEVAPGRYGWLGL